MALKHLPATIFILAFLAFSIATIVDIAIPDTDDASPAPVVPTLTPVPNATPTAAGAPTPTETPPAAILTPSPVPPTPTTIAPPTPGPDAGSVVTFYVCDGAPAGYEDGWCGAMTNGEAVHDGAVACGYAYHLGDQIRIVGDPTDRVYTCKDRGLLTRTQIDVFFWTYAEGRAWRDQLPLYPIVERVQ